MKQRLAPCNGTQQQRHHVHSPKVGRHPPPHHSTLEWHPAMAPRPLPQSWPSPSSPHHSTLQWHPAMAPSNGTTSTPPKLVVTPQPWHTTMAPSNGTTSTAPCNGTLVPRPIRQSGSSPSPLLEVRTPIAIAIWGKKIQKLIEHYSEKNHPKHIFNIIQLSKRRIRRYLGSTAC